MAKLKEFVLPCARIAESIPEGIAEGNFIADEKLLLQAFIISW